MDSAWLIDGDPDGAVPPDDRGLAYGDGLFETIAVIDGRPQLFDAHYKRLQDSCERLNIAVPSAACFVEDIDRLLPAHGQCVIKIIVTRGSAGRGYRPPDQAIPRRMVGVFGWPEYPAQRYTDGVRVISCATRLAENPALAGMKHLCRLEQVLAQQEVAAAGADEGIMQSMSARVISGTMSNLFIVNRSTLITPLLSHCGVAGIMRGAVMQTAAEHGIEVIERNVTQAMLFAADELFLSNAVFGIWPITVLDDIAFSVGAITQSLQQEKPLVRRS